MSPPHGHHRPRKIRRTGRHTRPSQAVQAAEKACRAAPAVAIAGALVAAAAVPAAAEPAAGAATVAEQAYAAGSTAAAATQARPEALVVHHDAGRSYTVRPGDTLSSIARRFYGTPAAWQWLYKINRSVIGNPGEIFPGQVLSVPAGQPVQTAPSAAARPAVAATAPALSGTLGCSGLEELWEAAGGSPAEAFMAAEIAMAESSGQQFAMSPTGDVGYWQINRAAHGALATTDPLGNARAAVTISDDGHDWGPWTTFVTGAYQGRC